MRTKCSVAQLLVVFAMFFSAIFLVNSRAFAEEYVEMPENTFPITDEALLLLEEEQPAVDAYNEILEGLGIVLVSDPQYPNYPDSYGGAYYEEGYLCICLTDDSESIREFYSSLVSDPSVIKFKTVEFSYNYLYQLSKNIAERAQESISSVSVNVYTNEVEVGIPYTVVQLESGLTINQIEEELTSEDGQWPVTYVYEIRSTESTDLMGGLAIYCGSSSATITICGTYNGSKAILTAGHAVTVGATYLLGSSSGSTIGVGLYSCYSSDNFYDYGIISVTNSSLSLTNKVKNSSNYTTITSQQTVSSSLVGTSVCKYGINGGFAVATIKKVNAYVSYGSVVVYGMSYAEFTSGYGTKGDSGGPVYSGHVLYGIYSGDGASSSSDQSSYFWFSPINGVTSSFSIKTS